MEPCSLKNVFDLVRGESWYPPYCHEPPDVEYCKEIQGYIIIHGRACGKRFHAQYMQAQCNITGHICPAEVDPDFYNSIFYGELDGFQGTSIGELGKIRNASIEPPGRNSVNAKIRNTEGNEFHVKSYRIIEEGNLEPYILLFLKSQKANDFVPDIVAIVEYAGVPTHIITKWVDGEPIVGSLVQRALETLEQGKVLIPELSGNIGNVLGKLHCSMRDCDYEWCFPEMVDNDDVDRWMFRILWRIEKLSNYKDKKVQETIELIESNDSLLREWLEANQGSIKMRIHGDPHLYQFLSTGNGLLITDFEGEPDRAPASILEKEPPVRDLAVIYNSLFYVAVTSYSIYKGFSISKSTELMPDLLYSWIDHTFSTILNSYRETVSNCGFKINNIVPNLYFWIVERSLYEYHYESMYKTGLEPIPLTLLNVLFKRFKDVELVIGSK